MKQLMITAFITGTLSITGGCKSTNAVSACKCAPCECEKPCPCGTAAAPGMMNDACPMSGMPLATDSPTSYWNGNTVGFCGNGCKGKFEGRDANGKSAYVNKLASGM